MLGGTTWRLGKVGGIELKIDPSWTFIALLIGYSFFLVLAQRFDETTTTLVVLAIVMAVAFFASVLLHELAHSWLARARGVEVKGITLFLFGGATEADLDTEDPDDELLIALVGPVTSLIIGGLFWALTQVLGDGVLAFATGYLGWINVALALFNLLPGFPLDGGRVLRSLVWRSTGDLVKATRIASRAGRILGMIVIGIGLFEVLFLGILVGGLWLVAIGWFLSQAAAASFTHLQMKNLLADIPASRLMTRDIEEMPAGIDLASAVNDYFLRHNYNSFPVKADDGTDGILTLAAVREVPREQWGGTKVEAVMEPLSEMCTVGPTDSMGDVVPKLMQGQVGRVVVVDDGTVVGLITPRDLVRWLQRAQELGDLEMRPALR
jgi:Zn-dependent protease/predicted transcriptional regulator